MHRLVPNEDLAKKVAYEFVQESVTSVRRFPTGLSHYVYDVVTAKNRFVVRMSVPENRHLLSSGIYWSELLRPRGVPLPAILYASMDSDAPYVVLERLDGCDLGDVYADLLPGQKQEIAVAVSRLHDLVAQLPLGSGFGFVSTYESGFPHTSWKAVIDHSLTQCRRRFESIGIVDTSYIDDLQHASKQFQHHFEKVSPTAFLDDTTVKNVIVNNGRLTGIVDVDQMCFGAPIFAIALTQMGLMSAGTDLDYIEYWCNQIRATEEQRSALSFYTGVFCVNFMCEVGQTFNKEPDEIDWKWLSHLKSCHAQILRNLI